jgi:NAD(P)-dependent dehydrogenase (short-subunit alcohol dehydrogenase family)
MSRSNFEKSKSSSADSSDVRFDGRVAIVTGAGRGMGREFAFLLASRGAAVVVNDLRPDDGSDDCARAVSARIRESGGSAIASTASVALAEGANSIVDSAIEAFGRVDIVINNAGNRRFKPFPELEDDDLDALFDVHVRGAWNITRRAWPQFAKQGYGKVLNVASVDGVLIGVPNHSAYGTCKGALTGMTRELAVEGAPLGITVNALLPGAATPDGMGAVEGKSYAPPINVTASVVAPGACWLVHEECDATGSVYSCSSGRMAQVFTRPAPGWQSHPDQFTLERVRDHWIEVQSTDSSQDVRTVEDWNTFRTDIFNRMLEDMKNG